MATKRAQPETEPNSDEPSVEYDRFEHLTKRLLGVSKEELEAAKAREKRSSRDG